MTPHKRINQELERTLRERQQAREVLGGEPGNCPYQGALEGRIYAYHFALSCLRGGEGCEAAQEPAPF